MYCQRCKGESLTDAEGGDITFCNDCGQVQGTFSTKKSGKGNIGKVQSHSEALDLFKVFRKELTARGKYEAFKLCERYGETWSQQVLDTMRDKGLLWRPGVDEYWIGSAFRELFWHDKPPRKVPVPVPAKAGGKAHGWRDNTIWYLNEDAICPKKVLIEGAPETRRKPKKKMKLWVHRDL